LNLRYQDILQNIEDNLIWVTHTTELKVSNKPQNLNNNPIILLFDIGQLPLRSSLIGNNPNTPRNKAIFSDKMEPFEFGAFVKNVSIWSFVNVYKKV
jgi:hypothetical protein